MQTSGPKTNVYEMHAFKVWQQLPDGRVVPDPDQAHRIRRRRELNQIKRKFALLTTAVKAGYWTVRWREMTEPLVM